MSDKQMRVIYESPAEATIFEFAKNCGQILAQHGSPSFEDPEVTRGLANFLKIVGDIEAKYRNAQSPTNADDPLE